MLSPEPLQPEVSGQAHCVEVDQGISHDTRQTDFHANNGEPSTAEPAAPNPPPDKGEETRIHLGT